MKDDSHLTSIAAPLPPDAPSALIRSRFERMRMLYQVSNVIHASLDPQQALHLILEEALRLTRAQSASIALVNPTSGLLEIEASTGLPKDPTGMALPVGGGITGWVAKHGQAALVHDVACDPRYIPLSQKVKAELAVPLDVDNQVRGVLNVDAHHTHAFTEEDQQLLIELARQASKVIHNTWLYEQLRFKAKMLESLATVNHTIQRTVNLSDTLDTVVREACHLMSAHMCSLLLLDSSGEWLELHASHGASEAYRAKPRLRVDESLAGTVVRRNRPTQIPNVQQSSRYHNAALAQQDGLVSLLCTPLRFDEQAVGVINLYTNDPHLFSDEELRIMATFSDASANVIQRVRLAERVRDVEESLRTQEKLSALGLLAAEVAHEIRNPLTVMKMVYHALDLRFPEEDPRAKDAALLGQKMDQLNQIVERILDFARQNEPNKVPTDLNQLVQDLWLLTRHKLKQHQIQFETDLAAKLPTLEADLGQLEQVLLNLTLNAVEAMPEGGTFSVRTRLVQGSDPENSALGSDRIVLECSDTGHGMSAEQQQKAFQSVLHSTKTQGTGLGLMVVHRIVEAHRGTLKIASRPQQGTTIQIELPLSSNLSEQEINGDTV